MEKQFQFRLDGKTLACVLRGKDFGDGQEYEGVLPVTARTFGRTVTLVREDSGARRIARSMGMMESNGRAFQPPASRRGDVLRQVVRFDRVPGSQKQL